MSLAINNKRKTASVNFSFSILTIIINTINGLILLPLYITNVGVDGYGIWLACFGTISLLGIAEFGLSSVLTQKLAKYFSEENRAELSYIIGSGLILTALMVLLMMISGAILIIVFPFALDISDDKISIIRITMLLASIGMIGMNLGSVLGTFCQAIQRTFTQNIILIIGLIANTSGILIAQLLFDLKISSFGIGFFLMGISTFGLMTALNVKYYRQLKMPMPVFNLIYTKDIIKSIVGLGTLKISNIVVNNLQAPIVAIFLSPELATVLNVTGKILKLCGGLVSSIMSSAFAGIVHTAKSESKNTAVLNELYFILSYITAITFGIALIVTKGFVINWVDPAVYGGIILVILIYAEEYIKILNSYLSTIYMSKGYFNKLSVWKLLEMGIGVLLLLGLLPLFKLYGMPISYTIGSIFLFFVLNKGLFGKTLSFKHFFTYSTILKIGLFIAPILLMDIFQSIDNKIYFIICVLSYAGLTSIITLALDKQWRIIVFNNIKLLFSKL